MTVGSLRVEDLKANHDYYTTIRAFPGGQGSGDGAGANAQYGIRLNERCVRQREGEAWDAWCALQGRGSDILIARGSYQAPGKAT